MATHAAIMHSTLRLVGVYASFRVDMGVQSADLVSYVAVILDKGKLLQSSM
jgi:hypothetical protein